MNKLIAVGTVGIMLAGCVGTSMPPASDRDDAEKFADRGYAYPNVRIGKLFGINPEVLANTNLFSVTGNSWHHYNLNLGKNENGFTTCTAHLEQDTKTGQLALEYISLEQTLKPGADDAELLRECRKAIDWANEKLGTDMELDALADLKKMRDGYKWAGDRCALALCDTSVYANLGEGQQVHILSPENVDAARDSIGLLKRLLRRMNETKSTLVMAIGERFEELEQIFCMTNLRPVSGANIVS